MSKFTIAEDRKPEFIGEIGFKPAFVLQLDYEGPHIEATPHGDRIFKSIVSGAIEGRIEGTVYPHGAGEYSLRRGDGVTDVNGHVLLQDRQGEWIYLRNIGYSRQDGYFRVTSWVDADVRGTHDWVLGLFFVGIGKPDPSGHSMTISYYEVL